MTTATLTTLLDRLARLHLQERRDDDLNPAQRAALDYLARANRFSRMPSAVADYLAATRGTVSQTLKTLARKGLIHEHTPPGDKRARRYDLTAEGQRLCAHPSTAEITLSADDAAEAEATLRALLKAMLDARDRRSFGVCKTCRYHGARNDAPYCNLLQLALTNEETTQICVEHAAA
ncbi:MarR family transcriptional regulator [Aquicoccus sp. G2-2]|uniref:MarR family transcriptional regulator n=1 Tax=Aquicoccus sp. G2-2 TaxID=3092120 RepID=UPI002AE009E0|nr:MarR family transcriptional regulator [Aquicoccus sp. G2-2]MEA1114078.1 MarR family transcriptional regulator [Aquicoccus sp. G2-2]